MLYKHGSNALCCVPMVLLDYLSAERGRGAKVARAANLAPAFLSQIANGVRPAPAEQCVAIERIWLGHDGAGGDADGAR